MNGFSLIQTYFIDLFRTIKNKNKRTVRFFVNVGTFFFIRFFFIRIKKLKIKSFQIKSIHKNNDQGESIMESASLRFE